MNQDKLPEDFLKTAKEQLKATKQFAESIPKSTVDDVALFANQDYINQLLAPLHDPFFKQMQSQLKEIASSISTIPLKDFIDAFVPIYAKASEILARFDWWIISDLLLSFYANLVKREATITKTEITEYIVEYFNQNNCKQLSDTVAQWDDETFKKREFIFKPALKAHKAGDYCLTVPALIVQIEGIIREYMLQNHNVNSYHFATVKKEFENRFRTLTTLPTDQLITSEDGRAIQNYYNLGILGKVFDTYVPSNNQAPDFLNRNAIGHGLWLDYSSKENSTQLFLLLDLLHSMLKQLKEAPT